MRAGARVFADHWQLILMTVVIFALWSTNFVWPLRVIVVLFHELSHAAIALLTGGEVLELSISRREGGFVQFRGGSFFWTASAGYIGSLLIGVMLMMGAVHTNLDRAIMMGLGGLFLVTVLFFVRDGFAILFMATAGLAFIVTGYWLPAQMSDLILRLMGVVSILYVPWDIATDTVLTANRMSLQTTDAAAIAYQLGLTEKIVGVAWILISLVVIIFTLRMTLRAPSNLVFKGMFKGR